MDAIADNAAPTQSLAPALDQDRELSPVTGWTRASYLRLLDSQLAACADLRARTGQIVPPSPENWPVKFSDPMEGVARSFLGAALRICADPSDPTGLIPRYRELLIAGCDPDHPDHWAAPSDRSQVIVEAAAIALGLIWTRPWLFETMPARERTLIVDYLAQVSGKAVPNNNWHLFSVLVDEFCQSAATPDPSREEEITAKVDLIDQWYCGRGWYTDGPGRSFDHYCGWAMHLYSLMWARAAADRRPDARRRLQTYRERLEEFIADYAPTFADDGAPLHFGRSLIYRHATLAPLWLGQVVGAGGPQPGVIRTMSSRTLDYFLRHGAFDAAGLPNLGWFGTFTPMVQPYSGPASPLWSLKGFLGLLLPADHPAWTQTEQEPEWQGRSELRPTGIDGVLCSRSATGLVRIANHGSIHPSDSGALSDPAYSRIGYSTHSGPLYRLDSAGSTQPCGRSDAATTRADGLDQGLSIARGGGDSHRLDFVTLQLASNRPCAASWHRPQWPQCEEPGPLVVSASTFAGTDELRVHLVIGAHLGDVVTDGGPAVTLAKPGVIAGSMPAGATASEVTGAELFACSRGILGWERAIRLTGQTAYDSAAEPGSIAALPALAPTPTAMPTAAGCALQTTARGPEPLLLVAAHGLSELAHRSDPPSLPSAEVEWSPDLVRVTLAPLPQEDAGWTVEIPLDPASSSRTNNTADSQRRTTGAR